MNRLLTHTMLVFMVCFALPVSSTTTPPPNAVVRAVLFYSPNCGHCQYVINEVFPPLFEQYGDQLSIIGIDVTQSSGQALFLYTLQQFNLDQSGVPFLQVGDTYLAGSLDIPEQFPGRIEQLLAQGGVDWPALPGLLEALTAAQKTEVSPGTPSKAELSPEITAIATQSPATLAASDPADPAGSLVIAGQNSRLGADFMHDLAGNSLAVVILIGMVISVGGSVLFFRREPGRSALESQTKFPTDWLIPVLCLAGIGVAGYLAYVEITQSQAVCGPVGDCNTVQQSEYAKLFGFLPIGILGVAGFMLILLVWSLQRSANQRTAAYASLVLMSLTAIGVLFSIYLTFLEPFVIGATCAWCLTSAIIVTVLFWLCLAPARRALWMLRSEDTIKS